MSIVTPNSIKVTKQMMGTTKFTKQLVQNMTTKELIKINNYYESLSSHQTSPIIRRNSDLVARHLDKLETQGGFSMTQSGYMADRFEEYLYMLAGIQHKTLRNLLPGKLKVDEHVMNLHKLVSQIFDPKLGLMTDGGFILLFIMCMCYSYKRKGVITGRKTAGEDEDTTEDLYDKIIDFLEKCDTDKDTDKDTCSKNYINTKRHLIFLLNQKFKDKQKILESIGIEYGKEKENKKNIFIFDAETPDNGYKEYNGTELDESLQEILDLANYTKDDKNLIYKLEPLYCKNLVIHKEFQSKSNTIKNKVGMMVKNQRSQTERKIMKKILKIYKKVASAPAEYYRRYLGKLQPILNYENADCDHMQEVLNVIAKNNKFIKNNASDVGVPPGEACIIEKTGGFSVTKSGLVADLFEEWIFQINGVNQSAKVFKSKNFARKQIDPIDKNIADFVRSGLVTKEEVTKKSGDENDYKPVYTLSNIGKIAIQVMMLSYKISIKKGVRVQTFSSETNKLRDCIENIHKLNEQGGNESLTILTNGFLKGMLTYALIDKYIKLHLNSPQTGSKRMKKDKLEVIGNKNEKLYTMAGNEADLQSHFQKSFNDIASANNPSNKNINAICINICKLSKALNEFQNLNKSNSVIGKHPKLVYQFINTNAKARNRVTGMLGLNKDTNTEIDNKVMRKITGLIKLTEKVKKNYNTHLVRLLKPTFSDKKLVDSCKTLDTNIKPILLNYHAKLRENNLIGLVEKCDLTIKANPAVEAAKKQLDKLKGINTLDETNSK